MALQSGIEKKQLPLLFAEIRGFAKFTETVLRVAWPQTFSRLVFFAGQQWEQLCMNFLNSDKKNDPKNSKNLFLL